MRLEFVKAYNVTKLVEKEKERLFSYKDAGYERIYIAEDTHDMQVYRILEGYNEEYEKEEGIILIEWNKIPNHDVAEKLMEMGYCNKKLEDRFAVEDFISHCKAKDIFLATLLIDNSRGLENWDNKEYYSMEEAIDIIDGGYGVIEEWEN